MQNPPAQPCSRASVGEGGPNVNNELRLFEDHEYTETSIEAPTVEPVPEAVVGPAFVVEIERSTRRKRTVGAQLVGGVLKIVIPSWMSRVEQQHWVES